MKTYDLRDRTLNFSKEVINYTKSFNISIYNRNIIEQLLRSSTSIGANYSEAIGGSSKKDFRNKIYICKKEAQETRYWLELLKEDGNEELSSLLKESQELILIFNKISFSCNKD